MKCETCLYEGNNIEDYVLKVSHNGKAYSKILTICDNCIKNKDFNYIKEEMIYNLKSDVEKQTDVLLIINENIKELIICIKNITKKLENLKIEK